MDPVSPSHRLGDLCRRYDVAIPNAHRALDDAEAARQVFLKQRERYAGLPLEARVELAEVVAGADFFWSTGQVLREREMSAPRSDGTKLVRNPVEAGGKPADVPLPDGSLVRLTEQALEQLPTLGYERREEQLAMARDVANALQYGGTQIVEAGTGTGKSLAYLVPAALWALKLGRTVLISTHTLNLQQQLAGNDVEFARRLIRDISPEAAGRAPRDRRQGSRQLSLPRPPRHRNSTRRPVGRPRGAGQGRRVAPPEPRRRPSGAAPPARACQALGQLLRRADALPVRSHVYLYQRREGRRLLRPASPAGGPSGRTS